MSFAKTQSRTRHPCGAPLSGVIQHPDDVHGVLADHRRLWSNPRAINHLKQSKKKERPKKIEISSLKKGQALGLAST